MVETCTHWFILYTFFHPRDWSSVWWPWHGHEHENDLEGYVAAVRKDGSRFGRLEAIVTQAHGKLYHYARAGSTFLGDTSYQ